ncbi:MAG: site-2 protease family protein [Elusimicrobiaceae bacterium]|jgi:Zn-dependent protease|nr:site-2 protease family protein [Elusimicrobiaceae bacterium]MBT3954614.1 site-2 protease family protein [Elusimicrobiaceae bacterium]MBT4007922.1 site-2 protease family protein [Elusimicrobiaceae bacterium]MBT4403152.1 site-2 protease family protein [Elusimicrobiaceae bacterium]MBT4439936.1 site-2 protease family protein [Elusimicrobiaceae bacterium]
MEFILFVPILLFSVIVHEYSHGYVAMKCGDDTAYLMGRLTFNPLVHIDIVGTVILPIICVYSGLPIFGWAKPVPVNPFRLKDPEKDMVKVAIAGPLANIMLVILSVLFFKLIISVGFISSILPMALVSKMMWYFISLNVILAIFNMVPIPPLDGSKVLAGFLPRHLAIEYEKISKYGFYILIALLFTGGIRFVLLPPFYFAIRLVEIFLKL